MDSNGVGSERGTGIISEASDDNDYGHSSDDSYYYPSSSSDHSEVYCNPEDNNGDIPQALHLRQVHHKRGGEL